jgi:hypothetical protein
MTGPEILGGRYAITEEIGRGGFSIVYGAMDRVLDQPVAIKLLVPPPVFAEAAFLRLRREVKAVRTLAHPRIVTIHDLIEEPTRAFIVMERIQGIDLALRVQRGGPLGADLAAAVGAQIADALSAAHDRRILHRDVKPQNILVADDGRAWLVDFGAARVEGEASLTRSGAFVGTLDYTPPEVLLGGRADPRADVYGLGMSLYFALAGKLPDRPSPHLPPPASATGHRPPTSDARDRWLGEIIARATASEPSSRFPTMHLFERALADHGLDAERWPALVESEAQTCLSCGATFRGGPICEVCARASRDRPEAFVFLDPRDPRGPSEILRLLAPLTSRADPGDLSEAARGLRPLAVARARDPRDLERALSKIGVRAEVISRAGVARRLPLPFWLMVAAMIAASCVAVGLGEPMIGAGNLAIATGIGLLGVRALRTPALRSSLSLAPRLGSKAWPAVDALDDGTAKDLLRDIVTLGEEAIAEAREGPDPTLLVDAINGLLACAAEAASKVAVLDRKLAILEKRGDTGALREAFERCDESRSALVGHLLQTLGTLIEIDLARGEGIGERLKAITAEIDEEVRVREEAIGEVEAIARS